MLHGFAWVQQMWRGLREKEKRARLGNCSASFQLSAFFLTLNCCSFSGPLSRENMHVSGPAKEKELRDWNSQKETLKTSAYWSIFLFGFIQKCRMDLSTFITVIFTQNRVTMPLFCWSNKERIQRWKRLFLKVYFFLTNRCNFSSPQKSNKIINSISQHS